MRIRLSLIRHLISPKCNRRLQRDHRALNAIIMIFWFFSLQFLRSQAFSRVLLKLLARCKLPVLFKCDLFILKQESLSLPSNNSIILFMRGKGRYRKVTNAFGVGKWTASETIINICEVISSTCGPKYMKPPRTIEEVECLSAEFYKEHDFPRCTRAID